MIRMSKNKILESINMFSNFRNRPSGFIGWPIPGPIFPTDDPHKGGPTNLPSDPKFHLPTNNKPPAVPPKDEENHYQHALIIGAVLGGGGYLVSGTKGLLLGAGIGAGSYFYMMKKGHSLPY